MRLPIYQIDAFASEPFSGNPAAVVPLDEWLPEKRMQAIAGENNLSETAFFVAEDGAWRIRWFTPLDEVDLCGHATLASAFVLFSELGYQGDTIRFLSRSPAPRYQSWRKPWAASRSNACKAKTTLPCLNRRTISPQSSRISRSSRSWIGAA